MSRSEHRSDPPGTILVVEDDESLRLTLADNLLEEGYDVATAADGRSAERLLASKAFDLIILDIMLPDTDGYILCRRLRGENNSVRILMLTARSLEEDLVRGFAAGADDYVAKPYRLAEVLARIRALLRRQVSPICERIAFGDFVLDAAKRVVTGRGGASVDLTPKEYELLAYLLERRGRALSRQEILDAVWGIDVVVDSRTVDNFVSNLKKKLAWTPKARFRLVTVRGLGYRMEVE